MDLLSTITNPYYGGCLREKVPGFTARRVCSTRTDRDFPEAIAAGLCRPPLFAEHNMEIRIGSGNWDSATALGWLTQIILSEILGVPTSMEANVFNESRDFYDPYGRVSYTRSIGPKAVAQAADAPSGDCRNIVYDPTQYDPTKPETAYKGCAHYMPETWGFWKEYIIDEQKVEPPQGIGVLGYEHWFVTQFTAQEFPQVVSHHGLTGEQNREFLASTFKRPTTWKDYCEEISNDYCATPDNVAQRPPKDGDEGGRYFVQGLYKGHFRATDRNDCIKHPDTCTGSIIDWPCGWHSYVSAQTHHLEIALQSDGPHAGSQGYNYESLVEIWFAANATKSDVMMMWWQPDSLPQLFRGTDAEMISVKLPSPTQQCIEHRVSAEDRCSEDFATRVGSPIGSCDRPVQQLHKMIVTDVYDLTYDPSIPAAGTGRPGP